MEPAIPGRTTSTRTTRAAETVPDDLSRAASADLESLSSGTQRLNPRRMARVIVHCLRLPTSALFRWRPHRRWPMESAFLATEIQHTIQRTVWTSLDGSRIHRISHGTDHLKPDTAAFLGIWCSRDPDLLAGNRFQVTRARASFFRLPSSCWRPTDLMKSSAFDPLTIHSHAPSKISELPPRTGRSAQASDCPRQRQRCNSCASD